MNIMSNTNNQNMYFSIDSYSDDLPLFSPSLARSCTCEFCGRIYGRIYYPYSTERICPECNKYGEKIVKWWRRLEVKLQRDLALFFVFNKKHMNIREHGIVDLVSSYL